MTAKSNTRVQYQCTACGAVYSKWMGQCPDCSAWNALEEVPTLTAASTGTAQTELVPACAIHSLTEINLSEEVRTRSGLSELDRALGGGLVHGSVILIGGDPGIGKSTLLLQTLAAIPQLNRLYVSGEESLRQITLRAQRLGLGKSKVGLLAETSVERIIATAQEEKPKLMVVDSIQALVTERLQSAAGSISQVRECAAQLVQYAKHCGTTMLIVGHVTKEGALAGPRVLEHMVDTVLYFEGDPGGRYRMLRAVKNRFGAVNELGIFAMTETGLKGVSNPSAIFLSRHIQPIAGSLITVTREGTRPLLVEIQALVDESHLTNPRRLAMGLDQNRLTMLLAILHKHAGVAMYNQDVFVNVVGGVRVTETGADLPVLLAALSSFHNKPLPCDLVVFGEVGLAGEIRPIVNGQERLKEAMKHGIKQAIIPRANAPKKLAFDMKIQAVSRLEEIIERL